MKNQMRDNVGGSPRWALWLAGLALAAMSAWVDWLTGPEIAFSVVYLAPISLLAWRGTRWMGLGMAGICGLVWLGVEYLTHSEFSHPLIPYWNALVRLTFFCLVAGLLAEVRERKQAEQSKQRQAGILQSILDSMGDGVIVADAGGRLLQYNPAAERILGIPAREAGTRLWREMPEIRLANDPARSPSPEHPLTRALRGEMLDDAEICFERGSDGEGRWLTVTGRPLKDAAGEIKGGVMVFSDITNRKKLERQIAEISDREQRRLGQDLHDGLCQQLVSAAFAVRTLSDRLAERSLPEAGEANEITELLNDAISQARAVARGLYLVQLEVGGLESALEELAAQARSRHRLQCRTVLNSRVPLTDHGVATLLFRIAQEAMNNAIKHANPAEIILRLDSTEEQVSLSVEDDGIGVENSPAAAGGMGLHLMNYRARMIGAALHIGPRQPRGTVVTCSFRRSPLRPAQPHVQAA